jgi:uncharacterized protein YdhG (YjbR/CyaY superfamily)
MLKPADIDAYISAFQLSTRQLLQQMRAIIKEAAPQAIEVISYGMPAFKQNNVLVYFAGYANHIGFYPTASGIINFKDEIAIYKNSKGAIQFPIDKPLPIELIKKIVKFRVKEDEQKAETK